MAKADLILNDGTKVSIDGSPDEVTLILSRLSNVADAPTAKSRTGARKKFTGTKKTSRKPKEGPTSLLTALATEGDFKTRRTIANIRDKLEERGHIYPVTTISPALTRLTRSHVLRRLKDNGSWVYVA